MGPRNSAASAVASRVKATQGTRKTQHRAAPVAAKATGESTAAAGANTSDAAPQQPTTKTLRSFRLDLVLPGIGPQDVVLSKQEGPALFSFLSFPGATPAVVAERLLQIEQPLRHVHSVFCRGGAKVDLAIDLDFAHCTAPKSDAGFYSRDSIVLDTLALINELYIRKLAVPAPQDIVVLDGHSSKKHSVHIHVRSDQGVFPDYTAAREVLAEINGRLKVPAIDLGVYRPNGMMRIALTPKYNEPSRILLPLRAEDSALATQLQFMNSLSDAEIVQRSLVVNPLASGKAFRGSSRSSRITTYDDFGHPVPPFMEESKKWLRFREAITAVQRYPISVSEEYDSWIRVGLALHSFGSEPHIKDHWKNLSARCPAKFNPAVCDKLWEKFGTRPNCFNWRRGYNYLVRTLGKNRNSKTTAVHS